MLREHWVVGEQASLHNRAMQQRPIVITGANGHLGRRLVPALASRYPVRALVRSAAAAERLAPQGGQISVQIVDYLDRAQMLAALADAWGVVHLVGIIKEPTPGAYEQAHEQTCRVLAEAAQAAAVERVVYLSILGSSPVAGNACLASKGRAEEILLQAGVPARILRVPMVLGEGDYASRALARRARQRLNLLLRGASLEQPIYAGDVVGAIAACLDERTGESAVLELAGPESLSRRALTQRAAKVLGRKTAVVSLPLALGMLLAWCFERLSPNPPVTRAMLGVLDHDDAIDPEPACTVLGLELLELDQMLARCLSQSQ